MNGQGKNKRELSPAQFTKTIKEQPSATVIDVRTPEEYSEGHLPNAINYDWNGDDFDEQVSQLDKEKPVLVYCRSGKRSASAASALRAQGFKQVYELKGGITEWKDKGLPITEPSPTDDN
jgi:rhodanese-related sulfurtransferase